MPAIRGYFIGELERDDERVEWMRERRRAQGTGLQTRYNAYIARFVAIRTGAIYSCAGMDVVYIILVDYTTVLIGFIGIYDRLAMTTKFDKT